MTRAVPTIRQAKQQAKRLRAALAAKGEEISHAQGLERIARHYGFRDWNALHAEARDQRLPEWTAGGRVTGHYLSKPFAATVRLAEPIGRGWFRLSIELDEAVDAVRFDSFSNLRKRITIEVGPDGFSKERTSDGVPHVVLDLDDRP